MFILSTFNQGQLTTSQSAGAVKNHILMDNKQNMETFEIMTQKFWLL